MAQLTFNEGAAPSAPLATKLAVYAKTDDILYTKNSAGTEKTVAYQDYVTGLGYQTSSGSVASATTAGTCTGNAATATSAASADALVNNAAVSNILPRADNTYNCGESSTYWYRVRGYGFLGGFFTGYDVKPATTNTYSCGASGALWTAVWATNGTIQTSDARLKTDVTPSPLGLSFIDKLRPVSYRWIDGGNTVRVAEDGEESNHEVDGTKYVVTTSPGKRTHYGLISQEVKAVVDAMDVGDFGGWVLNDAADPDSQQSIRYDQFIAPLIKAVQELSAEVKGLKAQVDSLRGTNPNEPLRRSY